jgi:hypothetical protein
MLKKNCATLKLAYGEETLSRIQTFELFSKFKSGMIYVEDTKLSGCPHTSKMDENVVQIKEFVPRNKYLTTCKVDHEMAIPVGSSQSTSK